MNNSTTLFILSDDTPDSVIAERAAQAASSNTHLHCLLVGPSPIIPTYIYSVPPYGFPSIPDDWTEQVAKANAAKQKRAAQVSEILAKNGASAEVTHTVCAIHEISHVVATHAVACDIATIADDLRDSADIFREAVNGILLQSPIGLILNTSPENTFKKVFVAWDTGKAAARALHDALPYLKAANEVIIACFDPIMTGGTESIDPGTDIAAWLSHHGCHVTLSQYPSGGVEIGQCIQDRATEVGADLVVTGAYGHSRMRQAVFGGTTRSLLNQTKLPLFLSH